MLYYARLEETIALFEIFVPSVTTLRDSSSSLCRRLLSWMQGDTPIVEGLAVSSRSANRASNFRKVPGRTPFAKHEHPVKLTSKFCNGQFRS